MITALTATLGAALFGAADFLGGLTSRKDSALVVTITAQAVGCLAALATVLVWPPESWFDPKMLWGIGAGVTGGTGVLALYAGLATGRMSVVAPITAALSGAIPAAVGLAAGPALRPAPLAGMVLALASVVIVSRTVADEGDGSQRRALGFALVAGVGFALSILCWTQTTAQTGLVPLAVSRATALVLFVPVALVRERRVTPAPGAGRLAIATGIVDFAANAAQVTALRLGPLAVASVLGALYPVATVVLARIVLDEHLRGAQRAGIALALIAVILTAMP